MPDLLTPNKPLQTFNTLALPAKAAYYLPVHSEDALAEGLEWAQKRGLPLLILGGGSNVVLNGDWPGMVIHIQLQGIRRVEDAGSGVLLQVAAGENWNALVNHTLDKGWFGLENLIAIPGCVGAAPIQNIGAYGVELSRFIESVEGIDIASGTRMMMTAEECELGYRDSIFKRALRNRFVITRVNLRLSRKPAPELGYKGLAAAFPDAAAVTPRELADHIAALRASKLPDPAVTPNAGSFFKNPVIPAQRYAALLAQFPGLVAWPLVDGSYKLAAAWLVEQCGWKGRRLGRCGVHEHQAIVLTNSGGSAAELLAVASGIRGDVRQLFDIDLEIEPTVYAGPTS